MPAGKLVQNATLGIADRKRARHAASRQMLHQPEKERQILWIDALFVEGQNERTLRRMHQIVGVLDALGDALARQQAAQVIGTDEARELFVADFGIDRHVCP